MLSKVSAQRHTRKTRALAVVYTPTTALTSDPQNPRFHSVKQIRQIARSIQTFGFNVPILIDEKKKIIAGHGRSEAAAHLGLSKVPTIAIEHLTEQQKRAFLIADNRLTEISTWDEKLLASHLKALSDVELKFDISVLGFETTEIDLLIEGLDPITEDAADAADELLGLEGTPVSKPGDLWSLGHHRVLCGDALEEKSFDQLLKGRKAAAAIGDPPYNVPIDGHASGKGKKRHREFAMACGEMTSTEFTAFLEKSMTLLARNSIDGSLHFVFQDWRHIGEILAAGKSAYTQLKNVCIWTKDNAGMGSLYRSQHEFVFVFKSGKGEHRNNIQLGQYGRSRSNVWPYPGANSFSKSSPEGNLLALHPTVKPVALVADAILDCTARNEIVLDPFLGSGTTVIAAERTGRICYGLEIDPAYVDTIVRRWQSFSGKSAVHEKSGRTFREMEEEVARGKKR